MGNAERPFAPGFPGRPDWSLKPQDPTRLRAPVGQIGQLWYGRAAVLIVNVSEAKTHLSRLIDRACNGEQVTIARNNLPLVDLVAHRPRGKRRLGLLAGTFTVPDGFTEADADVDVDFRTAGACSASPWQ